MCFPINRKDDTLYITREKINTAARGDTPGLIEKLLGEGKLIYAFIHEAENFSYTYSINNLHGYDYYLPELMRRELGSLVILPAMNNSRDTRLVLTSDQWMGIVGILPDAFAPCPQKILVTYYPDKNHCLPVHSSRHTPYILP